MPKITEERRIIRIISPSILAIRSIITSAYEWLTRNDDLQFIKKTYSSFNSDIATEYYKPNLNEALENMRRALDIFVTHTENCIDLIEGYKLQFEKEQQLRQKIACKKK